MSDDVRARIADALRGHKHTGYGHCSCGQKPVHGLSHLEAHALHLAAVLLSLPGIAVVEVPTGLTHPNGRSWGAEADSVFYTPADERPISAVVVESDAGEAQIVYPHSARAFAASLLAAADVAEATA